MSSTTHGQGPEKPQEGPGDIRVHGGNVTDVPFYQLTREIEERDNCGGVPLTPEEINALTLPTVPTSTIFKVIAEMRGGN